MFYIVENRVFSAITDSYVTVAIVEATADGEEPVTIEVKDSKGVVREVKPVTLIKGDKSLDFEFVKTVEAKDLVGVWTVEGKTFDLDITTNLELFKTTTDQFKFNKALTDLGIENVVVANIPTYIGTARDKFLAKLVEDEKDLTVASVQEFINTQNTKIEEDGTEVESAKAAVKAVFAAIEADNDIALLATLENDAFVRVNDEILGEYKTKLTAIKPAAGAPDPAVTALQSEINTANDAAVVTALDALASAGDYDDEDMDSVVKKDLNAAKDLIVKYATVNEDGEYTNGTLAVKTFKGALEDIEVQLLVADVLASTTPTSLKAKLTALDNLEELTAKFMTEKYLETNAKYYVNGFGTPTATGGLKQLLAANTIKLTVTEVETLITDMNTAVSGSYLAAVNKTDGDVDSLLKALKAFPGLKYVADSNKDVYWTADNANFDNTTVDDADKLQAAVIKHNIEAIEAAPKAKVIEALNVLELKNVIVANAEEYAAADFGSDDTIVKAQATVDATNHDVSVAAELKAINKATTVTEVETSLDKLVNLKETDYADADEQKIYDYLKIRSVDRDFVAAFVLEKRDATPATTGVTDKEYDSVKTLAAQVSAAQTAHAQALTGINEIKLTSTPDAVVTALDKMLDEDFAELSNVEKSAAAQAFLDQLAFDADGDLETQFVTLAAVKALL